jgi:hypothetical protein
MGIGLFAIVLGCARLPESTATTRPRPPPRPGSSITHSRMCSCTACARASCCAGGGDAQGDAASSSCESYDFSKEGCSLEVGSCASRCFERMWRVRLDQACEDTRPEECCG